MAAKRGIHATWIMLCLLLGGMSMLFLASGAALIYSKFHHQTQLAFFPWLFYINTALLLYVSLQFKHVVSKIDLDLSGESKEETTLQQKNKVVNTLTQLFYLSIVFLILQSIAWYQLLQANFLPSTERSMGYLYFFSLLHFIHVLGGLPFLWKCIQKIKIESLVQNEMLRRNINVLEIYWRFLDYVWIYIMVLLLISRLF